VATISEFVATFTKVNLIVWDEDGLAVILELFDGISDVSERSVIAGFFGRGKIDPGIPAPGQFFNR
jgi:hypothetical protein